MRKRKLKANRPRRNAKTKSRRAGRGSARTVLASGKGARIVGVGASAGGLEALEEFFTHLPPDTGMAFVVVTHQHPGHTSLLPELLRKRTQMRVMEARDGQKVEPNRVYLSRAGQRLGLLNGVLQIVESRNHENQPLPIDHFFRSLAEDQRERAIGIVLSGTGTDGTLGLEAIKGRRGIIMAQDPKSAKYSGMPLSAATTGHLDHVLPPEQMGAQLLAYAGARAPSLEADGAPADMVLPERLQKIIFLLRSRTGHDFSAYKFSTLNRRVERRMNVHQMRSVRKYVRFLQETPHEADLLFKEMLIGVTSFFRDPDAFRALAEKALPRLIKAKPDGSVLRAWLPGCSTGEEAYTLAIVLQECMERLKKRLTIQVFATDLDSEAINNARNGVYPEAAAAHVPRGILARHFVREEKKCRVKKNIRELVVFAVQNVIKDPPFTKLDIVACRNLLIYLKSDMQKRLLALFHYALKPQGLLFLGPSESIAEFNQHFAAVDKKWRIFTRKDTVLALHSPMGAPPGLAEPAAFPAKSAAGFARPPEPQAAAVIEKLLASRFVPASVLINARAEICYIHGRTGDYLEPASGQPRLNLLEMAREGLRLELAAAVHRVTADGGETAQEVVPARTRDGFTHVNITVTRLNEPAAVRGLMLVTFQPVLPPAARLAAIAARAPTRKQAGRLNDLERELRFTQESLRNTVEELQSSNEELQSTNEELQSSNEELETSREEMQSLNEELQTVNAQLQTKVDALSETNDDMQNLLNSTSIATLFLDSRLKIKRFTEQARGMIKLIPTDVGRPIGDLVSNLNYGDLEADAAEVLRTLHLREREVQTRGGDWRLVRILPYRTMENVIEGLVITFVDINRLKKAELEAQLARTFAESIVGTLREPILVLDTQLTVVSANEAFLRYFRVTRAEVERKVVYELGNGQWANLRLRQLLGQILSRNRAFEDFRVAHTFPRIGRRVLMLNARRLQQERGAAGLILLAMEDATEKGPGPGPAGKPGRPRARSRK